MATKLECKKWTENIFYKCYENLVNTLCVNEQKCLSTRGLFFSKKQDIYDYTIVLYNTAV